MLTQDEINAQRKVLFQTHEDVLAAIVKLVLQEIVVAIDEAMVDNELRAPARFVEFDVTDQDFSGGLVPRALLDEDGEILLDRDVPLGRSDSVNWLEFDWLDDVPTTDLDNRTAEHWRPFVVPADHTEGTSFTVLDLTAIREAFA